MGSRGLAAALLALTVALSVAASPVAAKASPRAKPAPAATTNASDAQSAYNGMQHYLYVGFASLYRETYPRSYSNNPYAYQWPFTQAMAGTIDMFGYASIYRSAVAARMTGLSRYWDTTAAPPGYDSYVVPPYGSGGDKYYDDNAWAGIDLERAYRMTGTTAALSQAETDFTFIMTGWDAGTQVCVGAAGTGGVYWIQQTSPSSVHDRNTVSTASSAELGLRLYQITGQQTYLNDALQMYDWVTTSLRDPTDGLYWDHVYAASDGSCAVQATKWSYNQGTMIGASVLLYQITGDTTYLTRAENIASAALARYGFDPSTGTFSSGSAIIGQGPAFNAIFFRNLLLLSSVNTGNATYRQAAQSYANLIWSNTAIRHTTWLGTLFYFQTGYVDLLSQAAMVEIYADLAWNPTQLSFIV